MSIEQLDQTAAELGVVFTYDPKVGQITIEGKRSAVAQAHSRIANCRAEVAALLRKQMGLPDPDEEIVRLAVPSRSVPDPETQRRNYMTWAIARGAYYTPTEEESRLIFAALGPGDEAVPDFAKTVTIRRANGLLEAIDRKGRIVGVPPYSPLLK